MNNLKNELYNKLYKGEKSIKIDKSNLLHLKEAITVLSESFIIFKFTVENYSQVNEALKSEETKNEFNNAYKELNKYQVIGNEYSLRELLYIDLENILFRNNIDFYSLMNNTLKTIYNIENKIKNYNGYITIKKELFDLAIYFGELNLLISFLNKYFCINKSEKEFEKMAMCAEKMYCILEDVFVKYLMLEEKQ